jgi:hypothetical protein
MASNAMRGAGNAIVTYDSLSMVDNVNTSTLTNTIAELEATVLSSTAEETIAGLGSYEMQLEGFWSPTIDAKLGPDSISGNKKTASIKYGSGAGNMVTYTWTTQAFISNYTITSPANEALGFSATLRLNGAPGRQVT